MVPLSDGSSHHGFLYEPVVLQGAEVIDAWYPGTRSAGIGRDQRYPWARLQPRPRR